MGRRNAIDSAEAVVAPVEALLRPLGFTRSGSLFLRRQVDHGVDARIEGISLRFEYGFRTCWLHVTVKYPALIELLNEVRAFAYAREHAWRGPDFNTHLACRLRLEDFRPQVGSLPEGLGWRYDSRLRRARPVPAEVLGGFLHDLVQAHALPALSGRLGLEAVAAASERPGYADSGIAGAWSLAAHLLLGDLPGAGRAFDRHPYSLGADRRRFDTAQAWLLDRGVDVAHVRWAPSEAQLDPPWNQPSWLTGALLP